MSLAPVMQPLKVYPSRDRMMFGIVAFGMAVPVAVLDAVRGFRDWHAFDGATLLTVASGLWVASIFGRIALTGRSTVDLERPLFGTPRRVKSPVETPPRVTREPPGGLDKV